MNPEINKFLTTIYSGLEGYAPLVTRDEDGNLTSEKWFNLPDEFATMVKYANVRADEDLYYTPSVYRTPTRTDKNATSRIVYTDADTCPPGKFRVPPSIVLETSPERYQALFVLDEIVPASEVSETSHRLAIAHKDDGCDISGWITSKLLRVPGALNTKYAEPYTVTATYGGDVYTLDTINDVYSDIETGHRVIATSDTPKPITGDKFLELENVILAHDLTNLYIHTPEPGQSWSNLAFRLELELFRAGLNELEVFSLMREAACNKFDPEKSEGHTTQSGQPIGKHNNPDAALWQQVRAAWAEFQETDGGIGDDIVKPERATTKAVFLTEDERAHIKANPCFVDEYTAWVRSRTQSAETYQRSFGWMLLSSVFGGRAYLPMKYREEKLNLWLLVLGNTTTSYKSTALKFYLRMVHAVEEQLGITIDIGSDATAEALIKSLGERDGQVSLLHTDEVNGFFQEVLTKNYRMGTLESYTALYDGAVPVVQRATKDAGNSKRADTVFQFAGVGIREKVAKTLTREHFESGFLARMLWTIADPPPRKPGEDRMEFADEEGGVEYDAERQRLLSTLIKRVKKWSGKPRPIRSDQPSQDRYHEWRTAAQTIVAGSYDKEVLEPSLERMSLSVLKASALIAMYNWHETITLTDTLHAIAQAELWFNDMVRMAREVSSSDFERKLNEFETFVGSGKSDAAVRTRFANVRPNEYREIMDSLRLQGRIRVSKDDRARWECITL